MRITGYCRPDTSFFDTHDVATPTPTFFHDTIVVQSLSCPSLPRECSTAKYAHRCGLYSQKPGSLAKRSLSILPRGKDTTLHKPCHTKPCEITEQCTPAQPLSWIFRHQRSNIQKIQQRRFREKKHVTVFSRQRTVSLSPAHMCQANLDRVGLVCWGARAPTRG